jgi:RNA polymerase sigma-70 factor (ECF subfamily)
VGGPQEALEPDDPVEAIYPRALPAVYGYLLPRCGSVAVAEDLTAETFMAAVATVRGPHPPAISTAWLIGVARHKLVDHWRRAEREHRQLAALGETGHEPMDSWDDHVDAAVAHEALAQLSANHRCVLVLRYLDDLPVAQVAEHVGRSVHSTETTLARARAALRRVYAEKEVEHGG